MCTAQLSCHNTLRNHTEVDKVNLLGLPNVGMEKRLGVVGDEKEDRHSQQSEHLTFAASITELAIYLKELVESKPVLKREWKYRS